MCLPDRHPSFPRFPSLHYQATLPQKSHGWSKGNRPMWDVALGVQQNEQKPNSRTLEPTIDPSNLLEQAPALPNVPSSSSIFPSAALALLRKPETDKG
ncbi:hypothetical protein CDEST_12404 [Colletotrichum destructivum]|uniref:Uncharacterized protein n=1 Tax=Colletotrichum destructivum TaxID=34406 RepID=A0AAX4IVT9_9PEZI|nr:hypothetical protein CDEST_12404 [Colletotrichum destructivum]